LPLGVLLVGIGVVAALMATRPKAAKQSKPKAAPLVHVMAIEVGERTVTIEVQGTVMPARKLVLQPEVTGRVVWQSEDLVPGGLVRAGQPLVSINPRDYQLAVQQQRAEVASQKLALELEQAQREVARREWELFRVEQEAAADAGVDPDASALALREPHLRSAQVALAAAQSRLAQAQLQLSRTGLAAPFNAFVQAENVEIGQLVGPSAQLATLVGTDRAWVQVSVPMDELGYLTLPNEGQQGAAARVWLDAGGQRVERPGRVLRLLGDLDPAGRMARLLVEIDDPLGLDHHQSAGPRPPSAITSAGGDEPSSSERRAVPLLMGAYVHVELRGKALRQVAEIPERALRPGGRVFAVSPDNKLDIRQIQVMLRSGGTVVVRGPLRSGDRLVLTAVPAPVAGMDLRVTDGSPSSPEPASADPVAPPAPSAATSAAPEGASP